MLFSPLRDSQSFTLLGLQSANLHRGEVGNAKSQEVVERDGAEALP